mmetsp:Transcript_60825/g.162690  ORF Transcript_60825/g.162690 Transcript_60825/m.162690 type:complete len:241 (+) Transcript_60825:471-1193(+)
MVHLERRLRYWTLLFAAPVPRLLSCLRRQPPSATPILRPLVPSLRAPPPGSHCALQGHGLGSYQLLLPQRLWLHAFLQRQRRVVRGQRHHLVLPGLPPRPRHLRSIAHPNQIQNGHAGRRVAQHAAGHHDHHRGPPRRLPRKLQRRPPRPLPLRLVHPRRLPRRPPGPPPRQRGHPHQHAGAVPRHGPRHPRLRSPLPQELRLAPPRLRRPPRVPPRVPPQPLRRRHGRHARLRQQAPPR